MTVRHTMRLFILFGAVMLLASCGGDDGDTGAAGADGTSCTVVDNGDGTKTLSCDDGTAVTLSDGADGGSCTVTENGDGTQTVSCDDGTSVTLPDGAGGAACTVADNGDGTKTLSCDDGTVVIIADGSDGADGGSCTVVDNGDGTKVISCDDGTEVTVADGEDGSGGTPSVPILEGHNGQHGYILPYDVQAAFNDDTFFWQVSYRGNEGKRHQYLHYTGGEWVKEGGDRRDAQGSIDGDTDQGDQGQLTTIYEQRTSIMVNDPSAASHVTDFDKFGCYATCHNDSRHMPEWNSANGHDGKWVAPAHVADGGASSDKVLDLWHWRGARSNPIARADDQYIKMLDWPNVVRTSADDGGRKGDGGTSVFRNQGLDSEGNPEMLLDPSTTWGDYTFAWNDFWSTPFYYMTEPNAAQLGATTPNPVQIPYADAVAAGYTPSEGDTVPRRILRAGEGSRADITAYGTEFISQSPDGTLGVWNVQMQRLLDTGHDDDVAFVAGQTYGVGFEVHLWEYTTRDHYISFPHTMSLGAGGDIEATDLRGSSGPFDLPNWDDTATFPVKRIYLFQPGIATWEFVSGENDAMGKVYTDPATGAPVDQVHGGATAVAGASNACSDCHSVRNADPAPPLFDAGSMEALAKQRGGIWLDTPTD